MVWGKLDRVIDYRNADVFVEAIPNARKAILDEIGHAPMVEAPEQRQPCSGTFLPTGNPETNRHYS